MDEKSMDVIDLNPENIRNEHICCAIGEDKENMRRAQVKKEWLIGRFSEGHVFKKVNVRGKVFIEYTQAEKAWFPILANGYVFIQCFWVSGKYQGTGLGSRLLKECEKDCRDTNGLVAISSPVKLPFLSDKKFFTRKGFVVCDVAENGMELLVKMFKDGTPEPRFTDAARRSEVPGKKGITFYYSDMCPFVPVYADIMKTTAEERGFSCELIKLDHIESARNAPTPFTIFSVFMDGKFLTHELMTGRKFSSLLDTLK